MLQLRSPLKDEEEGTIVDWENEGNLGKAEEAEAEAKTLGFDEERRAVEVTMEAIEKWRKKQ